MSNGQQTMVRTAPPPAAMDDRPELDIFAGIGRGIGRVLLGMLWAVAVLCVMMAIGAIVLGGPDSKFTGNISPNATANSTAEVAYMLRWAVLFLILIFIAMLFAVSYLKQAAEHLATLVKFIPPRKV